MKVTVECCDSAAGAGEPVVLLDTDADDKPVDSVAGATMMMSSDNSDLEELKKVTARLRLDTRRPSIVEWQALRRSKCFGVVSRQNSEDPEQETASEEDNGNNTDQQLEIKSDENNKQKNEEEEEEDFTWRPERVEAINSALQWLRQELQEMRRTDAALARQLITARTELHRLKLAKSCTEHAALLEDVALALDERDELSELSDLPLPLPSEPLKELGVTRMHFSNARRFSLC